MWAKEARKAGENKINLETNEPRATILLNRNISMVIQKRNAVSVIVMGTLRNWDRDKTK